MLGAWRTRARAGVASGTVQGVRSEDELRRRWVAGPRRHDAAVTLVDYDPAWPERFAREAERIRAALGDRAVLLEHVGSTSVPGLAAKPIIDIVLAVADSAAESDYVPRLVRIGYVLEIREPDWHEHRMLSPTGGGVNLHVFSAGAPEIARLLRFRDRLRASREDRERYLATKRALAGRTWAWVQDYADAKSAVVEEILTRSACRGCRPPSG
jgi:GrpB-like predicted nucleotidyltransferase (UPF0157 family)